MSVYADVDEARPPERRIRGSSFRHRRLVLANYVVFDPVELARPSMRPAETALLGSLLKRAHHSLEFGAGGSTTLALKLGVGRIVSVESDASWIARIHGDWAASRAIEDGRLTLLHADIGPIGRMGGPGKDAPRQKWPSYARTPWPHIDAAKLDLVLIDGRFRVACALEAALRCADHTAIVIHDFWNRPAYHGLLPFFDALERCQTMGVFRIRRNFDRNAAAALLEEAAYRPY
jgi:hypothetical protein